MGLRRKDPDVFRQEQRARAQFDAEHLCLFMGRSLSIVLDLPHASFLGALGPTHRTVQLQVLQVPNLLQWPLLTNTATQLSRMMQSPLAIKPNSRTRGMCEPPHSPPAHSLISPLSCPSSTPTTTNASLLSLSTLLSTLASMRSAFPSPALALSTTARLRLITSSSAFLIVALTRTTLHTTGTSARGSLVTKVRAAQTSS